MGFPFIIMAPVGFKARPNWVAYASTLLYVSLVKSKDANKLLMNGSIGCAKWLVPFEKNSWLRLNWSLASE